MSENGSGKKVSGKLSLYESNHFDEGGLDINRAGRLSARQLLNAVQVLALVLIMAIGAGFTIWYIPKGFGFINAGQFQQAFIPCGSSVAGLGFVLYLYYLGSKIGIDRYFAKSPMDLLQKMLVVVDIILGRVEMFEGRVARGTEVETTYEKKSDGMMEPRRTTRYFYYGGDIAFRVPSEGYEAFPSKAQNCRLYYLPSSKVIVNLEFIER